MDRIAHRARRALFGLVVTLAALLAAPAVRAQDPLETFDGRIRRELRAQDPAAADVFDQANAARDRNELEPALEGYLRVHAMVPSFFHATRRACTTLLALGRRDEALPLCREATAAADVGENHVALAEALAWHAPGTPPPSAAELTEASSQAERAQDLAPNAVETQIARCDVAAERNDRATFQDCAAKLLRIEPDALGSLVYGFAAAMDRQDWDTAATMLSRARQHGLPAERYAALSDTLRRAIPWPQRAWPYVWRAALAWIGALVGLFLAGLALSAATLAATRPGSLSAHPRPAERVVRKLYALVLVASCALYYASLPIVMLVMAGLGVGLVWVCVEAREVPIKLVLIAGAIICTTLWSLVRSMFFRARPGEPGTRLNLLHHPALRATLDEVAARIGTRPVDVVYTTPGTDIAVLERGGLIGQLRGRNERCLVLGVGVLDGMSAREFRAILAHEYGHFRNEDTAGGRFALAVRTSLLVFAIGLARGGAATWINPAWVFIVAFERGFLRVSQGASRLQEILADRWAAHAYGAEAFVRGLQHVVERTVRFEAHVGATLADATTSGQLAPNLYTHVPRTPVDTVRIADAVAAAIDARPSAYASHPSPAERFERVRALALEAPSGERVFEDVAAWTLFSDRARLETAMTDEVRAKLAARRSLGRISPPPSVGA